MLTICEACSQHWGNHKEQSKDMAIMLVFWRRDWRERDNSLMCLLLQYQIVSAVPQILLVVCLLCTWWQHAFLPLLDLGVVVWLVSAGDTGAEITCVTCRQKLQEPGHRLPHSLTTAVVIVEATWYVKPHHSETLSDYHKWSPLLVCSGRVARVRHIFVVFSH